MSLTQQSDSRGYTLFPSGTEALSPHVQAQICEAAKADSEVCGLRAFMKELYDVAAFGEWLSKRGILVRFDQQAEAFALVCRTLGQPIASISRTVN